MKNRLLLPIFAIIILVYAWQQKITVVMDDVSSYKGLITLADAKYSKGLYQDAYDVYLSAYEVNQNSYAIEQSVKCYTKYYEKNKTDDALSQYVAALNNALTYYPEKTSYWEKVIGLNLEAENYDEALSSLKKAYSYNVTSKTIDEYKYKIKYSHTNGYRLVEDYLESSVGYYFYKKSNVWHWLSTDSTVESEMEFMNVGYMGSENIFLCQTEEDGYCFMNVEGVKKGIVNGTPTAAGAYSCGYCPLQIDGKYQLVSLYGNVLVDNLEWCGSLQSCGYAAAKTSKGKWELINQVGEAKKVDVDEIKTDWDGRYCINDAVLAKKGEEYYIYNMDLSEKVDGFKCADVDILTEDGIFAFKNEKGKWGYADTTGKVIIKPEYEEARSFSNGLAAVSKDGRWGFIDKDNVLVVDYQFIKCGYLSDKGSVFVSDDLCEQNGLQYIMNFRYPELFK